MFRVPPHAWNSEFFISLADTLGKFICLDDPMARGLSFDVARMLLEVPLDFKMQNNSLVEIDDKHYNLIIREECGRIMLESGNSLSQSSAFVS